jgi:hypothetical protein
MAACRAVLGGEGVRGACRAVAACGVREACRAVAACGVRGACGRWRRAAFGLAGCARSPLASSSFVAHRAFRARAAPSGKQGLQAVRVRPSLPRRSSLIGRFVLGRYAGRLRKLRQPAPSARAALFRSSLLVARCSVLACAPAASSLPPCARAALFRSSLLVARCSVLACALTPSPPYTALQAPLTPSPPYTALQAPLTPSPPYTARQAATPLYIYT